MIYNSAEAALIPATSTEKSKTPNAKSDAFQNKKKTRKEQDTLKLKEVERQQTEFGKQK